MAARERNIQQQQQQQPPNIWHLYNSSGITCSTSISDNSSNTASTSLQCVRVKAYADASYSSFE
jgi:hypothetical protein